MKQPFIRFRLSTRLLATLSATAIFLLLLTGCGADDNSRSTSSETAVTTITMVGFPAFQQTYERLADQFQAQHPTIEVHYIALDQQSASLSLRERAALADVIILNGRPPAEAAVHFLDLTPLATADADFTANDFWPGLLAGCQAAGVQVGLPLSAGVDLIFYHKATFDAADLPYPEPGWDWPTFQQTAQRLAIQDGTDVIQYGFVDSGRPLSLLGPLVDDLLVANDNRLDSEWLAAELAWYVTFAQDGILPAPAADPQTAVANRDNLIRNRQTALWLGSQFELSQWQAVFGDNLGVAAFPTGDNPARPTCAAISAGTGQAQAAWSWLQFLSNQAAVTLQSDVPARPSVAQSSGYWADLGDETAVALRHALEQGWYGSAAAAEMRTINDALLQAVAGDTTLAQSLPTTIEPQPTAPPPTPDSTPIAVATPRLTPTPAALPGSSIPTDNVIVVDYYAYETSHSSRAALEALARAFNEAQNSIEVRLGTGFGGTYITDVADNYDCFAWGGLASSYIATTHPGFTAKFYSLTALMAGEDAAFAEDFSAEQLAWSRFEGELYALPVAVQPQVIQYNADLLASLGVDPPAPDWTADEFWDVAIAATRSEGGQRIYGFLPAILMPESLPLLFPEGAYPFDGYSSPPVGNFTDPAVIQGLTWLANMVENRVMFPIDRGGTRTADNPRYDSLQMQEQSGYIVREEAAMWVALAGQGDYHFATGAVPFPQTSLLPLPSMTPSLTALYISRRANNPLGCWEWLKFLSAQPDIFPGIPVRHSVMESSGWVDAVGSETAAAYRVALSQPIQPVPDQDDPYLGIFYPHYRRWWSDALHEVFAGGSPADVLTEMQRRTDAYLTCIESAASLSAEQITACDQQAAPGVRP